MIGTKWRIRRGRERSEFWILRDWPGAGERMLIIDRCRVPDFESNVKGDVTKHLVGKRVGQLAGGGKDKP